MRGLPSHHVARPRLTSRCESEQVVVVEAAGGYGKSVFAAELVDAWGLVGIDVTLHEGGVSDRVLVSRLRAAIGAAGFALAAEDARSAPDDPVGALDVMLASLCAEPCAFVIDDVHHADRDAALLVDRIAARLQGDQRLVVLGRRLPPGAERLRRADALQLTALDLALTGDETIQLCRVGFGLEVGEDAARAIDGATGGWTAAAVLAAARARRTGESVLELAEHASSGAQQGAIAAILDEALGALGADGRAQLSQVARLALLRGDVVDAAVAPGFFDRLLAAGAPLYLVDDGWWELAGPVRDFLADLAPPDEAILRRAAARYRELGQFNAALDLLASAGDSDAAAEMLSGGDLSAIDAMDVREFRAAVERLGDAAIEAHPMVLVLLSRFYDAALDLEPRERVLVRLEGISQRTGEGWLARAVEAERATDLVREGRFAEAEARARDLLAATPGDEGLTRARALSCLGRTLCWHYDDEGRRDAASLREADSLLEEAADTYERLGMRAAAAGMVPYRAIWIEFARGDAASALVRLDEAMERIADRPRRWAYLASMRAEVTLELGDFDETWRTIAELERVATQLHDDQMVAYAHWNAMSASSHGGDAAAVIEHLRIVESLPGDWWQAAGGDFCAAAADDLGRVGEVALAHERLEAAKVLSVDADALIAMSEAALLARHGDPEEADAALLAVPGRGIDPREYWRVELLRAYAAFRRGDRGAGPLAARALESAAALGLAHLPLTKERELTSQLVELAAETGLPAATALQAQVLPVSLFVLGRFELTRGGREVALTPGLGAQLVKHVAVSGGRVLAERAIETLWPEVDLDAGRHRLRTVLNRLRNEAGGVIAREGASLVLDPSITVDLTRFDEDARRAAALGRTAPTHALALAKSAISRYRGELLPDDLYEEWTEAHRRRVHHEVLELLELCCDIATERGNLDETRWAVERAIELAPDDDRWYATAAATLLAQGRRGAAIAVLRRAREEMDRLGLPVPARLEALEREVLQPAG